MILVAAFVAAFALDVKKLLIFFYFKVVKMSLLPAGFLLQLLASLKPTTLRQKDTKELFLHLGRIGVFLLLSKQRLRVLRHYF